MTFIISLLLDVLKLRQKYRIIGTLIGCHATHPNQNQHLGLPLKLSREEITLLLEKGIIPLYSTHIIISQDFF